MCLLIVVTGCQAEKVTQLEETSKQKHWGVTHVVKNEHEPGEKKIKVAVLDSGIADIDELRHAISYSYNTFNDEEETNDEYGHGTMIASIIAAKAKDVSVNTNVELLDIQVLNEKGQGNVESVVKGIHKAIEQHVDIINLSIGFSNDHSALQEAVQAAIQQGIVVVASTGNTVGNATDYPAQYEGVLSVSAVDENNERYLYAGKGKVDIVAPGVDVPVINAESTVEFQSGTSFATAYATGILSLYMEKGEVIDESFLKQKTKKIGELETYGLGLLTYE